MGLRAFGALRLQALGRFFGVIIILTIVILIIMAINMISMMMIITIILSMAEFQPQIITRGRPGALGTPVRRRLSHTNYRRSISSRSDKTEATPLYGHSESSCDCMGPTTSTQASTKGAKAK